MSRKKNRKKKNKSIVSNQKKNQQLSVTEKVENKTESETVNSGTENSLLVPRSVNDSEFSEDKKQSSKNFFLRLIDLIIEKQVLSKIFIILFATFVFSFAYKNKRMLIVHCKYQALEFQTI